MTSPAVVAEWEDDNWLRNIIGPERLELGDEFGCHGFEGVDVRDCLLYTSPSPRDVEESRMPSSA